MKTYTVSRTYGDNERETPVFASVPADIDFHQLVIHQLSSDIADEQYTMGHVDPDIEREIVSGVFRMYDGDTLLQTVDAAQFWTTDDIAQSVHYDFFGEGGPGKECVHYRPPWLDTPNEIVSDPDYRPF